MQASVHPRCLGIKLPQFCLLIALLCGWGSESSACIDYGDYLHWIGNVQTPGSAYCVAVSGAYAYVVDFETGLQVIDIANPQTPEVVGSVDTPYEAYGLAVSGTHAYVAHYYGLQVIDITNPQSPQM